MKLRALAAVLIVLAGAGTASAAVSRTDRFRSAVALASDGSLLIDNLVGPVTVVGTNRTGLRWEAVKHVRGGSAADVQEGREFTRLSLFGRADARALRTVLSLPLRNGRWESSVSYTVEVPATIDLTIVTMSGDVKVSGMTGQVTIKNVNGTVELERLQAPVSVETVNGIVRAVLPDRPSHPMALSSLTGRVEVHAPNDAAFTWVAETIRGSVQASFAVPASLERQAELRRYTATIRAGGPRVAARSVLGDVYLLRNGATPEQARGITAAESRPMGPLRPQPLRADVQALFKRVATTLLMQVPTARLFASQQDRVPGDYRFETPLGSIFVGEIDGNAQVSTRAGEIVIGRVSGRGELRSMGGSIHLGDLAGAIDAHTSVGDIIIRSLAKGGTVKTDGGMIRIGTAGGPLMLRSGGGDVIVHRAAGDVDARTTSGDVWVHVGPTTQSARIDAVTEGGNVALHIPADFGGEIDATVVTGGSDTNAILSDFTGLTIVRETVGEQTRVRATGRLGSGGQRVVLRATDGTIQIRRSVDVVTR